MGLSVVTYALCKKYVEDTAIGLGAVKGANCQIQSITPIPGGNRVTFLWKDINGDPHTNTMDVMNGEGGEGGTITNPITASLTVGGVTSGTVYPAGTAIEQILRDMLNPISYPTLTPPSASLSSTGDKLLERGSSLTTTFTLRLNRGSINPAYGTSGYRSGPATGYTFDGETTTTTNTFVRTITEDKLEYQGSVSYSEGEQPFDSKGNIYNVPLPAGSVNSNKVVYEFVDAWWGNGTDPDEVAKLPLISEKPGEVKITFAPVSDDQAETFDVPATWTITAIKVYNPISQIWDIITNQFSKTDITHVNTAGETVNYKRYTCNLGYGMGERELKIEWSTN